MKKFLFFIAMLVEITVYGQKISFPTPEIRTDTVSTLQGNAVVVSKPMTLLNKFTIKGSQVPPSFYMQVLDSAGYNRFGLTKNGMLIAGTHHDPQVNIDGLFLFGRGNALKGADSFVGGKGVVNQADTAGALGYYFTQAKDNSFAVGYKGNRIEMAADSGRFIGNWKFPAGISEAPQDGNTYGRKNATWVNIGSAGETDPVWTAASANYYTKTNLQTSGGAQVHWNNITNKPAIGTVTSVGLSMPGIFSVTGSPVTGSGTLTAALASQTQATVFAAPAAANGVPVFRTLAETDIPNLNWTKITNRPTTLAGYGITDAYTKTNMQTSGQSLVHWDNITNKPANYILPPATTTTLGGIKVGSGLSVTADGTLSASGGGSSSLVTSNSSTITFTGDGTVTTPLSAATVPIPGNNNTVLTLQDGIATSFANATLTNEGSASKLTYNNGAFTQSDGSYLMDYVSNGSMNTYLSMNPSSNGASLTATESSNLSSYVATPYSLVLQSSQGTINYRMLITPTTFLLDGQNAGGVKKINLEYLGDIFRIRNGFEIRGNNDYTTNVVGSIISTTDNDLSISSNKSGTITLSQIIQKGQIITQATEPDIPNDSFAFWVNGSTFYLILDSGGVQKKVQLQ